MEENFNVWEEEKRFRDVKEANNYLDKELWCKCGKDYLVSGTKIYYKCRVDKNCKAKYAIQHLSYCRDTIMLFNGKNHDHTSEKRNVFPNKVLSEVVTDIRMRPKLIKKRLSEKEVFISTRQINNYKQRIKSKTSIIKENTLNSIKEWAQNNYHQSTMKDMDKPIVLNHCCNSMEKFRVVISTVRMISLLKICSCLHVDSTYKLNMLKYPLMIIGTTDAEKSFHPIAFQISYSETEEDYIFMFKSINESSIKINHINPKFQSFVADGAKQIHNALKSVYGQLIQINMCWAHASYNMFKAIDCIRSINIQTKMKGDLRVIQLSSSFEEYNLGKQLFIEKWNEVASKEIPIVNSVELLQEDQIAFLTRYISKKNPLDGDLLLFNKNWGKICQKITTFVNYFREEWAELIWFEGSNIGYPSTNNCLESFNLNIKEEGTFRSLLPINEFLSMLNEFVRVCSQERSPTGEHMFATEIMYENSVWVEAYTLYQKIKGCILPNVGFVFNEESEAVVNDYPEIITFNDFKDRIRKYVKITYRNGKAVCSCIRYLKDYYCRHILAIKIIKEPSLINEIIRYMPMTGRKKRGRRKLVGYALEFE